MFKRVSVWWSRHVLSARPAVIYTVAVVLCLLLGWVLALLATLLQENTELQWRAESVAGQLDLQLAQGEMALSRIDSMAPEVGCLASSAGLAAIVQSVPHARYAMREWTDGRRCSSGAFRVDAAPAQALVLQAMPGGGYGLLLSHRVNGDSLLEINPASLLEQLQTQTHGVRVGLQVGAQYLTLADGVVQVDAAPTGGLLYRQSLSGGKLDVVVQETWTTVLLRSLLHRLDTMLLALAAGGVLGWALMRRRLARNTSTWEIAQGIRNREFFTHYQPIVTAESGECVGVEVLARWRHPVQGAVRSDLFIPAAEDAGMIVPLTRYLLRRVCKELKPVALPPGFMVGVNIAAEHLGMPDLIEDCKMLLAVLREKNAVLVLEVSERLPLPEHQVTHRVVQDLRQMGVKLALDDFGLGHADRNYLRRWGFDYLKVEKGYVSALGKDSFKANILDGLLSTSRLLGVQVIVKGVETQGQQNYLSVKGFQLLQGFYFGKPMTLNHFRQWLYSGITQDRSAAAAREAAAAANGTR